MHPEATYDIEAKIAKPSRATVMTPVSFVDEQLDQLDKELVALVDRLEPILCPDSPRAVPRDEPTAERQQQSHLAYRAEQQAERLQALRTRVQNIYERLDL